MKKLLLLFTTFITIYGATFNVSDTPELRTALNTAATNGEDDTIILADGTYKTTDDGVGTFIYLSNESSKLTLQGSSNENVILSGDTQHQILNTQSIQTLYLVLNNISFIDGNNTTSDGGAIYTDNSIEVNDCNISNNYSYGRGGGLYSYTYSGANINNSIFINNQARREGGGIYSGYLTLQNSKVHNNSSQYNGGGLFVSGLELSNTIITNNSASSYGAMRIWYKTTIIKNSIIANNSSGIALDNRDDHKVTNSIFYNNGYDFLCWETPCTVTLYNNYIDESDTTANKFLFNNIYNNITLGFVDETNGDYNLISSSDLIDAGTTDIAGITFPTIDLDGNARVVGGSIDIGPYEFSTTKPTINTITFTGEAKEATQLTFTTDYTLAGSRTISKVEYDYNNDGTWTTLNTHTFNTKDTYTIGVKITDSESEFSFTTKIITIVELPFSDMTDDQKLVKAIDPLYYDSIIEIINNKSQINSLTASSIDAMQSGWTLTGTASSVTDMSIFNNASIVWIYTNGAWSSYSSNATMIQAIQDANIPFVNSIPANSGIWVKK